MDGFTSRHVSKDNISEQRFGAYYKARKYITHLNNFYEMQKDKYAYDESLVLNDIFQQQTPENSLRKISLLPKAKVTDKVLEKIKMLNVFQNLSERKIRKTIAKSKEATPVRKKNNGKFFDSKKYTELMLRLNSKNLDLESIEKKKVGRGKTEATPRSFSHEKYLKNLGVQDKSNKKLGESPKNSFEFLNSIALPDSLFVISPKAADPFSLSSIKFPVLQKFKKSLSHLNSNRIFKNSFLSDRK